MAKNIIFLDIDGVLNNDATTNTKYCHIDDNCLKLFYDTIKQIPDCKIVISSSWRRIELEDFLKFIHEFKGADKLECLVKYFHEDYATKRLNEGKRGYEIKEWLSRHFEVKKYICLDDDSDYLKGQRLLQINRNLGFSRAEKCLLLTYFGVKHILDRDYGLNMQDFYIKYGIRILKNRQNFIDKYIVGNNYD